MEGRIHFDGWTLLRSTGELTRGTTRVRLQGQPLQVLEALLAHPGELVTREQLMARLWPGGVIVDFDTALNSAIRRLRTALDDHADHPRYIETIPRRGYRFIGQIERAEPRPVLPVESMSGTETGRPAPAVELPGPHVASTARTTLPGRVPRKRWDHAAVATVAMVGLVLAAGLGAARWPGAAPDAGMAQVSPVARPSSEAREKYERARFLFGRRGEGDTTRALALFQDALRADPTYAQAWAGIASVHWIDTMERRTPREQGLPRVLDAATRALALDPNDGEALMRLANYHMATGQRELADAVLRRAETVAPNHPLVLTMLSGRAREAGRLDEAVQLQRRAIQNDPLAITPRYNLVVLLFVAQRYEEARAEFQQLSAISPPRFPPDTVLGQSLLLGGDAAGALEYARTLPAGVVREQLEALSYFALGQREEADAALRRLTAHSSKSTAYRVAEVLAYRGETDAAFTWLERALRAQEGECSIAECWPDEWVAALPLLRTLHTDPRWPAIYAALVSPAPRSRRS